jgi:hypothetical protein
MNEVTDPEMIAACERRRDELEKAEIREVLKDVLWERYGNKDESLTEAL